MNTSCHPNGVALTPPFGRAVTTVADHTTRLGPARPELVWAGEAPERQGEEGSRRATVAATRRQRWAARVRQGVYQAPKDVEM